MTHFLRFSKLISIIFIVFGSLLFAFANGSFAVHAQTFTPVEDIQSGDLIRVNGTHDVYIVKFINGKRFKRLILSPEIFNSYNSFDWENVKTISRADMDFFVWSDLVVLQDGDRSLYRLFPQQSDDGVKTQVQLSSGEFVEAGGDWDSLFEINEFEFLTYRTIRPLTTIQEFQSGVGFVLGDREQDDAGLSTTEPPTNAPAETEPEPEETEPVEPEQPVEGVLLASRSSQVANNQVLIAEESRAVIAFKVRAQNSASDVRRVDVALAVQGANNTLRPWSSFESISLVDLDRASRVLQTIRVSSRAHIASNSNSYTYRFQGFSLVIPQDGTRNFGVVVNTKQSLSPTTYRSWVIEIPQSGIRGIDGLRLNRYAPQQAISRTFSVKEAVGEVAIRNVRTQGESAVQQMRRDDYTDDVKLLQFEIANNGQIGALLNELKFDVALSHNNSKTLQQVIDSFALYQGSSEIASIERQSIPETQTGTVVFSDFNGVELRTSAKQMFTFKARIMPQANNYPLGTRVQVSIGNTSTNQLSFSYDDGRAGTATGSATGMPQQLFVVYPKMGVVQDSIEQVRGVINQAEARFNFTLEAMGGNVYISDVCEMMGGSQASFIFEMMSGVGTNSLDCALTTNALEVRNGVYKISKNTTRNFALTIRLTSYDNPGGAFFSTRFRELRWSTTEQDMFTSMDSYEIIPDVVTGSVFLMTPSDSVAPPTIVLDKIANVAVATGSTDNILNVSWDSVEDATSYDVWHCVGLCVNDSDWTKTTSTTNSKQLVSLSYNTTYNIKVRAKNGSTTGEWSDVATGTTSLTLIKTTGVSASTGTDDTKLSVSFDTQSKATGYEVEYRTSASAPSGSWSSVSATTSPKELTSLIYNTSYQIRVRAKNGATTGAWSDTKTQTTSLTLTKVTGVSISTGADDTKLSVRWTTQSKATGYEVEYRVATNDPQAGWSSYATTSSPVVLQSLVYNTSYQLRVRATTTGVTGVWSDIATYTTSLTLTKVAGVSVSDGADDTKLSVAWTTQSKATNYEVEYRTSASAPSGSWSSVSATTSPKELTSLIYNTSYQIRVRAKNGATTGAWSDTATQSTSLTLVKVTGVSASTGTDDTKLSVSWTTQSKATNYDIEYRTSASAPSGAWSSVSATTSPKVLTGLTQDTEYQVRVRAKTTSVTGDWSDTSTKTTSFTLTLPNPSAPTVSLVDGYRNSRVAVVWTAVVNATGYDIQYKKSTQQDSEYVNGASTNRGVTITGLDTGTSYDFRYRGKATNNAGNTVYSDWSTVATKSTSPLAKIAGVSLSDGTDDTKISVAWTTQSSATSYEIEYRLSSSAPSGSWSSVSSNTSPKVIDSLTYNTQYQVRVRAKTASVTGDWSDIKTHTTSLTLVKVTGVAVSTGTDDTKLSVSWTTQSKATNYDIWHCTGSCTQDSDWTKQTSTTSPKEVTGLTYNTAYKIKVRAKTASATGPWSDTATHTTSTTLVKVTNVVISTGDADTKLSVAWTTQSKATSYEITYRAGIDEGEEENEWSTVTSTTSPKVLTGLTHDTEYEVRVRAKTSTITGDWSDATTKTTSFTLTLPSSSAPTVTLVDGYRDSRVTVVWTAVVNATGYDIQYKKSTQQDSEYVNGSSTNRGVTITGLDGHTSYDFRYRAKATNSAGTTIYSAWSDVATKSTDFVVAQTANLQASVASSTVVHLTWDDVNNAAIHHIQHCKVTNTETCGSTTTAWSDHSSTPTASKVSYTDLTPATTYKFRVRGRATHNSQTVHGAWSSVVSATTHSQLGKAVISSVATQSSTSLKVDWGAVTSATGYIVEHKTGQNAWTKTTISSGSTTTTTITGLSAETQYSVRVKATTTASGVSNGHWSDATNATTHIAKTTGLSFVSQTNAHIKIQWTQVGSHLAYQIRYKKNQGSWSTNQSHSCSGSCSTISYDLTDRVAGTRYDIQVRVKTSSNVGDWSDTLTYTTPLSKVSISSTSKTDSSITLNWSAVAQATSYEYEHKASSDSNWSTTKSVTTTTVTISSLDENKTYKARVRAKNAQTTGDWSDESSISTDLTFTASATLTVSQGTDDTKLSVSWTTQARATGYDIEYRKASTAPSGSWSSTTTQTFPKVIENLTANTNYQVRVRAKSAQRTGAWSSIATKATSLTIQNPSGFPTVQHLTNSDSQLKVTFTTLTNATSYDLQYCKFVAPDYCATGSSWTIFVPSSTITNGNGSFITGLERNTRYQVRYRGKATDLASTVKYSNWSTAVTQATHLVILKPSNIQTTPAQYSIALDWGDISAASNYEVQYCTGSCNSDTDTSTTTATNKWKSVSTSLTASQVTVSSLTRNTNYHFRIRGTGREIVGNTMIYGTWSDIIATTTTLVLANPSTPQLSAVAGSSSEIKVTFSTISGATGYDMQYCKKTSTQLCDEADDYTNVVATITTTPYTLSGLEENKMYYIKYRGTATNLAGTKVTSNWSSSASQATNLILQKAVLETSSTKHLTIDLDWGDIADATGYEVQHCTGSCTTSTAVDTSTATNKWKPISHTTTTSKASVSSGLVKGTTYNFRVRAKATSVSNATVYGEWSSIVASVAKQKLAKVVISSISGSLQRLDLSWGAITGATGYSIRYKIAANTNWNTASVTGSTTSTTLSENIISQTVYVVQIKATATTTNTIDGEWSDTKQTRIYANVNNLVVSSIGTNTVSLSWDSVVGATSYDIWYCASSNLCIRGDDWSKVSSTTTSVTIKNLLPAEYYFINVRARRGTSTGYWASASLALTKLAQTRSVRVLRTTTTTASLMWVPVAGAGQYDVWHCTGSCASDSDWTKITATTYRTTISNLTSGATYKIKVRAKQRVELSEALQYGSWSTVATATTALSKVSNVSITPSVDSLSVSWDAVANATGYTLKYRPKKANGLWREWSENITLTTNSATLTDLNPGTEHAIKIRVRQQTSTGPASATYLTTTLPPKVHGVQITKPADTTKLQVSWTHASTKAGSRYYQVRYRKTTDTTWTTETPESQNNLQKEKLQTSHNTFTLSSLDPTGTYYVQVRVKLAFLNSEPSTLYSAWSDAVSDDISIAQVSETSIRATTIQDTQITVAWTALQSTKVTGYEVRHCTGNCLYDADWTLTNSNVSNTGTQITGLTYDTIYKVQVRAVHTQSDVTIVGAWSESKNITTAFTLGVSSSVTASTPTNNSLNVSWSAVPEAASYRVEYKAGSGSYQNKDSSSGATSITLNDLYPGTTYTIRMRAQATKADGTKITGGWSATTTGTTTGSFAKPSNVSLSASSTVFGGIRASWDAVSGAEEYQVQHCVTQCTGGSAQWTSLAENPTTNSTDFSASFETRYYIRVRAKASTSTDGQWSDVENITTGDGEVGIEVDRVSTTSIQVSWQLMSGATEYDIQHCKHTSNAVCTTSTNDWSSVAGTITTSPQTIHSLEAGAEYRVRIRAKNTQRTGAWSYSISHIQGVTVTGTQPYKLAVNWNKNNSATSGYVIQYKKSTGSWGTDADVNTTSVSSIDTLTKTLTALDNNTQYNVRVRAIQNNKKGFWSSVVSASTVNVQVQNVTATATGSTTDKIDVSWDGQSYATQYDLWHCTGECASDSDWTKTQIATGTTSKQLTGLTSNTTYKIKVRLRTATLTAPWSSTQTATTLTLTTLTVLAVPADVSATAGDADTKLNVTWSSVLGATGYDVWHCTGECTSDSDWTKASTTATSATLSGLTRNTAYKIKVRATNSSLTGTFSSVITTITSVTVENPSAAPTVRAVAGQESHLSVSFSALSVATGYEIQHCKDTGTGSCTTSTSDWTTTTDSITTSPYTLTGLTKDTKYKIRYRGKATNLQNISVYSRWSSISTSTATTLVVGQITDLRAIKGSQYRYDFRYSQAASAQRYEVQSCIGSCTSSSPITTLPYLPSNYWRSFPNTYTTTQSISVNQTSDLTYYRIRGYATNVWGRRVNAKWSNIYPIARVLRQTHGLSLNASTTHFGSVQASWTATPGALEYEIDMSKCISSSTVGVYRCVTWSRFSTRPTSTSATIPITSGDQWAFRVRAKNLGVVGSWSAARYANHTFNVNNVEVQYSNAEKTQATLKYKALTGGTYTLEYKDADNAQASWVAFGGTMNPAGTVITGLDGTKRYAIRIKASSSVTNNTDWQQLPQAPMNLTIAVGDTNRKLNVGWSKVTLASGGYQIRYKKSSDSWSTESAVTMVNVAGINTLTKTLTGLDVGTSYDVQVRAKRSEFTNFYGWWTDAIIGITSSTSPDPPSEQQTLPERQTSNSRLTERNNEDEDENEDESSGEGGDDDDEDEEEEGDEEDEEESSEEQEGEETNEEQGNEETNEEQGNEEQGNNQQASGNQESNSEDNNNENAEQENAEESSGDQTEE